MIAGQIIVGTNSKPDQLQSRKVWEAKIKDNILQTKN